MPSHFRVSPAAMLSKRWPVALCRAAAAASGAIAQAQIAERPGARRVARARQIAIYLAHVGFGVNYTHLGEAFGRDRTTIRHACARIEDARDELRFDRALSFLEDALRLQAAHIRSAGEAP
jgi:chromosomal replication initiation ATPase DnaA